MDPEIGQGGRFHQNPPLGETLHTYILDLCVSSLRRGHANLLCIVPIFSDAPRRGSNTNTLTLVWYRDESCLSVNGSNPLSFLTQKELPIGESNPGRERDRLECYQLHQPGLSSATK